MDDKLNNRLLMEMIGKKFYGHQRLHSKYQPQIPASAEREYQRVLRKYMDILRFELEVNLPLIKLEYADNINYDVRLDGIDDVFMAVNNVFTRILNSITDKVGKFGLKEKIQQQGRYTLKMSTLEWAKCIKATFGLSIFEDYYNGGNYERLLEEWQDYNLSLISSLPQDTLENMRKIIYDGFTEGGRVQDISKKLVHAYDISKSKADFLARDQIAKLNGQITRYQQMDAGVNEYMWRTVGDERTRDSHKELNGKIFSWDDPPMNSDGRACHPAEDYGCRCVAIPVFDRETLTLPLSTDA